LLQLQSNAPNFSLPDQEGNIVSLSDFKGRWLALTFYLKDFTPFCTMQLNEYAQSIGDFEARGISIAAISRGSVTSHKEFSISCEFPFPLLADCDGAVCKRYNALTVIGIPRRVLYMIDPEGVIRYRDSRNPFFFMRASEILDWFDSK
jgi:peroxiredoxin Q/BCP